MGADFTNLTNPITSVAGGTTVTGSVDIINDNLIENSEGFTLHLHNCTNTASSCFLLTPYSNITINDDDSKYYDWVGGYSHLVIKIDLSLYSYSHNYLRIASN